MAATGEYYSQGKVQIAGTTLPTYETDRFTISRAMLNLLDTLDENGDYPVNSKGEAYGSAMLASVVGYEPDLISAIGTDGIEGYLRLEDTIAANNTKLNLQFLGFSVIIDKTTFAAHCFPTPRRRAA